MKLKLSKINVFPVKSFAGISVESSKIVRTGFEYDRRWMVVDPNGRFLTQRDHPRMATLSLSRGGDGLLIRSGKSQLKLSEFEETENLQVEIWGDTCAAVDVGDAAARWITQVLGKAARIVHMPDSTRRIVKRTIDGREKIVSFADGYPFLLIGEASLRELNSRLEEQLGMERFRPNLVVSGSEPFAEDGWSRIRIGNTEFHVVKPCARCVIPTIDQQTGMSGGKEPLRTMADFRRAEQVMPGRFVDLGFGKNDILFGQNLVADSEGDELFVGDEVEVLEQEGAS